MDYEYIFQLARSGDSEEDEDYENTTGNDPIKLRNNIPSVYKTVSGESAIIVWNLVINMECVCISECQGK